MADFFAELDNATGEVQLVTEGLTWDSFRDNWAQTGKRATVVQTRPGEGRMQNMPSLGITLYYAFYP